MTTGRINQVTFVWLSKQRAHRSKDPPNKWMQANLNRYYNQHLDTKISTQAESVLFTTIINESNRKQVSLNVCYFFYRTKQNNVRFNTCRQINKLKTSVIHRWGWSAPCNTKAHSLVAMSFPRPNNLQTICFTIIIRKQCFSCQEPWMQANDS